ncbi:MAG: hypothetical protein VKI42_08635 [Synechococcaceae cyanobacterium]|nr:hypothetical protein [Synechococcaceae cyanobacterium]
MAWQPLQLADVLGPDAEPENGMDRLSRRELATLLQLRSGDAAALDAVLDQLEATQTAISRLPTWRVGEVLALVQQQAPRLIPPNYRNQ